MYQVVVRSILLYGCKAWLVRVVDESILAIFDRDKRWNCVATPVSIICRQGSSKRLHWFGFSVKHPNGELIGDFLFPQAN